MPEAGVTRRGAGSSLATVAAIAATYVYFLIFAEFALLELVRALAPDRLRFVMAGLGAGGVAGAVLAARCFPAERRPALLAWSFRACALAAGLAYGAATLAAIAAAAGLVGLALGALTVTLTASLRGALPARRLGLGVGAGTGLAYALCNVPVLFQASPRAQTLAAAVVVLLASWLPQVMATRAVAREAAGDFSRAGVSRWLVVLLALVWMDSAAFYIVQHTPDLRAATWGGTSALVANAFVHLGAALAAGALLDRAGHGRVAGVAAAALAAACLVLNGVVPAVIPAAWWYTAGVSLYSTVLVDYPARSGRPGVAALVFAVAGWIGSALGIGMAQDLQGIPLAFVVVAVVAVAGALAGRARAARTVVAVAAVAGALPAGRAAAADAAEVVRGREVYIAEGCLHCHSQFVRPKSALDVERWGPAVPLAETLRAAPPLLGNRRQGPDLANVGNRRSPEWNRLHLLDPRSISPGSRMPRYAHLFGPGDGRGDALVAYLASLGADTYAERQAQIARWTPSAGTVSSPAAARRLFAALCAPCHGVDGRGDGPVAAKLSLPPPDWTQAAWRHVPAGAAREAALSRIIKFGLPGLPMAGHEYLPDGDIVGLARLVRTMHKGDDAARVAGSSP
ncbi:MAG: cbb3-type cytochrome c oxidase subunit II [Opitutaceae bacterium]|nr:cbb3-type cytochrome c oxidase subunit II [Opitutaceae bacterium]